MDATKTAGPHVSHAPRQSAIDTRTGAGLRVILSARAPGNAADVALLEVRTRSACGAPGQGESSQSWPHYGSVQGKCIPQPSSYTLITIFHLPP